MKIDIIGNGNVGVHLERAFSNLHEVKLINSRTLEGLRDGSELYIISVSDNAISEVAASIFHAVEKGAIIVHTSGTMPLDLLSEYGSNIGVIYPLQTFSKNVELDYSEIPFFIESSSRNVNAVLRSALKGVCGNVLELDSNQRCELHIASVLSCNFVNHLWSLANEYLDDKGIDFKLLYPLIKETCRKLNRLSPFDSQTGPAVRHDSKTINKHKDKLKDNKDLSMIYSLLSDSIENKHTIV